MSANLVVDLQNTTQRGVSITDGPALSGSLSAPASGAIVGQSIDLLRADTYCNLFACGVSASGQLRLQVQCSDTDTSGTYTDPTSGMASLPGAFQSGTVLWVNSGGAGGGLLGAFTSGEAMASGFFVAQGFVRTGRFARVVALNEGAVQYAGGLTAGFISNLKVTGSGGGFSWSPANSGQAVSV